MDQDKTQSTFKAIVSDAKVMKVWDLYGKLLHEQEDESYFLSLDALEPGVYRVEITTNKDAILERTTIDIVIVYQSVADDDSITTKGLFLSRLKEPNMFF